MTAHPVETSSHTPGAAVAGRPGLREDPDWFRTAVFYEVLVRAFADSTGSGSGDFTGLIGKLDYLQSVSYTHLDVYKRQPRIGGSAFLVGASFGFMIGR